MPKKKVLERSYYEPVRQFLKTKMECVVESYAKNGKPLPFVCRGLDRVIVDVYGLRGVNERHSRAIEGIAVEVKRSKKRTSLRNLLQTSQYSKLAHRCYLAQPRKFDRNTIMEAARSGIGLLEIHGMRIKTVAESRRFSPDPELFLLFLHKSLSVLRCALCGCYRFRYGVTNSPAQDEKPTKGVWVSDQIAPLRRGKRPTRNKNKKMFVCDLCRAFIAGIAR